MHENIYRERITGAFVRFFEKYSAMPTLFKIIFELKELEFNGARVVSTNTDTLSIKDTSKR